MLARWFPHTRPVERTEAALAPAVDRLFDDALTLWNRPFAADRALPTAWGASAFIAAADVVEGPNALEVSLDVPGCDPNAIQVRFEGDVLTVQAERKQPFDENHTGLVRSERAFGTMTRSFVLPKSVDGAQCEASYSHGVLTMRLPKREEAKPRSIEVKVHS